MQETCKYCPFVGEMDTYVGFFPQVLIAKAHEQNQALPKFGYHLGKECPSCKRHQKWMTQTDEMLLEKYYVRKKQSLGL